MTSNRGRLFFLSYARGVSDKPAPQFDSEFSEYMELSERMFFLMFQRKKLSCSSVGRFEISEESLIIENHLRNIEICRDLSSEAYCDFLIFDFRGTDLSGQSDGVCEHDFFRDSSSGILSKEQIRDIHSIRKNHDYFFRVVPTKEIIIFDHFSQSFAVRGEELSDSICIRDHVEIFNVNPRQIEDDREIEEEKFLDYLLGLKTIFKSNKVIQLDSYRRQRCPDMKGKRRRSKSFLDGILSDY